MDNVIALLVALVLGGIMLAIAGLLIVLIPATNTCLAAGYPKAHVDFAFNAYCVKRVYQTDVVVPISQVKK